METTRNYALKCIVALAWENDRLWEILESLDTTRLIQKQEQRLWDYYDASLQLSSRMALLCLQKQDLIREMDGYVEGDLPCRPGNTPARLISWGFLYPH